MNVKQITFEESMNELEKIVADLEKGDLSLDESVKKFEEGMKLSKKCNEILEETEKKITVLIKGTDKIEEKKFINEDN